MAKGNNDKNTKSSNIIHISAMAILFIIGLLFFMCLYERQNDTVNKRIDGAIERFNTNSYKIIIDDTNNTKTSEIYEELNTSITKSIEGHYLILKESIYSTVKDQTNMMTFWFSFLSIIMVVFTILGVFVNNNIIQNTKEQSDLILKDMENKISDIDKQAKSIKEDMEQSKENAKKSETYSLFSEGLKYYNEKNYDMAIEKFTEVIKLTPSSANAYGNRGNLYSTKYGCTEEDIYFNKAEEDYNEAIRLNSNNSHAYNNIGYLYFTRYEIENDKNYLYKAEKNIDIALSIDKNNVSALTNKGEIYIYRYEIEKNIKLLKDAKNYLEESEKVNIAKIYIEETHYYYSLLYEKFSKVKNTSKKEKDEYKKLSKDYLIKSAKLGYNKAREKCKKDKVRF